ncbi:MAG: M20/M25/M40 family metallo-hydrolase [Bacillota bacterium]|nr:M20/M25/M40 family metallo-hydrolase [Bacillota bacterium]
MSLDKALSIADGMGDWLVEQTIEICKIPAPGFEEKERAEYVASKMKEFGLADVRVDQAYNAVGILKGKGGPAVLFAAHIDTVFPRSQPIEIRREPGKVWAPGIRDNSSGTAGMLGLIKVLKESGFTPKCDLIFVGTSGEEGLGDLKGIKQAMKDFGRRTAMVVCIDGDLGGLTHMGVGSRRLKVTIHAAGGHSYGAFGASSAIHSMGRMIAQIADIKVPIKPKTTYNVGVISGGHSVNSIATEAWMLVDMRSEGVAELTALEKQVREVIEPVCAGDSVKADIEVVGDRPAGGIPKDHPLVKTVEGVQAKLGMKPSGRAGSTDANVPLNMGIPAVCIGCTTGGNGHRPDEWLDEAPFALGLKQLIMVTAELAG